jgi:uncharacterized protein YjbI with pentapeptide repeats
MSKLTARFTHLSKRARVLLAVVAALVVVVIVGGALLAGNPSLLARLTGRLSGWAVNGCVIETYTICRGADLAGLDLTRASLGGSNLVRADLAYTNLTYAQLWQTLLTDTNLVGANLVGANLSYANLTRANLVGANLAGADMSYANLTDAVVCNTIWSDGTKRFGLCRSADLTGQDLSNANLSGLDLTNANLTKANLTGANLSNTQLTGVRLCATTWTDGTRRYTHCDGVDLSGEALAALPSASPPGTLTQAYQLRPRHVEGMCQSGNASGSASEYTMSWTCSNQASDKNQQWTFVPSGNFYQVKIGTSGYCLDVEGAAPTAGATVIAHACRTEDNANQLWHLDATGDGGYWLINKNSGLCAAPKDGGTTNDTVTVQYPCTSDPARLWGLHGQ